MQRVMSTISQNNFKRIHCNTAKCLECGVTLTSQERDQVEICKCGNLSIRGGTAYTGRTALHHNKVKDLTTYTKFTSTQLQNEIAAARIDIKNYRYGLGYSKAVIAEATKLLFEWYQIGTGRV